MKIAIWLNDELSPHVGGAFSYTERLIRAIDGYEFSSELEICFVSSLFVKADSLRKEVVKLYTPFEYLLSKVPYLRDIKLFQRIAKRLNNAAYRNQLESHGIKLIFYPSQFINPIKDFPFIASHWDIAHRSTFAFPEFSFFLQDIRDEFYKSFFPRALMIFVESEAGKRELIRYSGLNEERIAVVPIFAGSCASLCVSQEEQEETLKKLSLEKYKYFYYPAQFLAEKNHYAVIEALSLIVSKYPDYKVVFTGSSSKELFGTRDYIKTEVGKLGLSDQVVFAPFQSINGVYSLYKNACAHIMASYVGPTNMPPLEAMFIGCPVICSDISGHREEMGDAAIYFDAKSSSQLADAMVEMIENRDVYLSKIEKQSLACKFTMENALKSINNHFLEASIIRRTWS